MRQLLLAPLLALFLVCCSSGSSPSAADAGPALDASTSDASTSDGGTGGPGQSCTDPMHTPDVADGPGTCATTIDAYCAKSGASCPAKDAWCADGGTGLTATPLKGTCGADSLIAAPQPPDGEDFFYYDSAGKLLAIAHFIQDPARCIGARKYVCVAGAADFDPSATMTCASTQTTAPACP